MSSMTAFVGSPAVAAYGSSRAFVESLGEAIGYEQRHEGLDFLVCNAGVIRERKARTTPASIRESLVRPPVSRPDAVARAAIRALGRRRVVVPGTRSALLSVLLRRLVPTRWMVRLMAWTVSTLHIDDYELEQRESH